MTINRSAGHRAYLTQQQELRNAVRAQRTNAQQIALLDQRLGKGQGAKRERAKLEAVSQ